MCETILFSGGETIPVAPQSIPQGLSSRASLCAITCSGHTIYTQLHSFIHCFIKPILLHAKYAFDDIHRLGHSTLFNTCLL